MAQKERLTSKQHDMLIQGSQHAYNIRARGQALKTARSLERRGFIEAFNQDWDVTEYVMLPKCNEWLDAQTRTAQVDNSDNEPGRYYPLARSLTHKDAAWWAAHDAGEGTACSLHWQHPFISDMRPRLPKRLGAV